MMAGGGGVGANLVESSHGGPRWVSEASAVPLSGLFDSGRKIPDRLPLKEVERLLRRQIKEAGFVNRGRVAVVLP